MSCDNKPDNNIVGIRPGIVSTEIEVDEKMLSVAQQLLDKVKSGQVKAFSWVTVGTGEEAAVTAFKLTQGFCAMPLLGALEYTKYRIATYIDGVNND
jgi:hypothetical protein